MINKNDPVKVASELLEECYFQSSLIVDPINITSRLGVKVVESKLPPYISGSLVKKLFQEPTIVLNCSDSIVRKRINCAFELGNYISKIDRGLSEYINVSYRGDFGSEDHFFATKFATSLLIDRRESRKIDISNFHPVVLQSLFGVTDDAIMFFLEQQH